jgi:hypothetical protein
VLFDRVDGKPDDFHVALVELRLELGHIAELRGAHRGEVLGVREQHGPGVADPLVKTDTAVSCLGFEIRGGVAEL